MTWDIVLLLIGAGLFGGAWNAVAGGATLFTFPALLAAGLPPVTANATNFLALLPSNAAALPAYRRELAEIGAGLWPLLIVSGTGAIVGSVLLTVSDPAFFVNAVPPLILFATALFAFGGQLRQAMIRMAGERNSAALLYVTLFVASIYGGYFGAGLGIILLGIVQVMGYTAFNMANSLKNFLATTFTLLSIAVFGVSGLIAWPEALIMMSGSTVGGYLGGRYARLVSERILRTVVIIFGIGFAAIYFIRNVAG
jgi:uncharacterized membrane protein YfcA